MQGRKTKAGTNQTLNHEYAASARLSSLLLPHFHCRRRRLPYRLLIHAPKDLAAALAFLPSWRCLLFSPGTEKKAVENTFFGDTNKGNKSVCTSFAGMASVQPSAKTLRRSAYLLCTAELALFGGMASLAAVLKDVSSFAPAAAVSLALQALGRLLLLAGLGVRSKVVVAVWQATGVVGSVITWILGNLTKAITFISIDN